MYHGGCICWFRKSAPDPGQGSDLDRSTTPLSVVHINANSTLFSASLRLPVPGWGPALSAASTRAALPWTTQASRCVARDLALLIARRPSRLQAIRLIRHNDANKSSWQTGLGHGLCASHTSSICGRGRRHIFHEAVRTKSCDRVFLSNCLMQPRENHVQRISAASLWSRVVNGVCALLPSPTSFCCHESMQYRFFMCTATEMQKAAGVGSVVWGWPMWFVV